MAEEWAIANRLSDRIVALANEELKAMRDQDHVQVFQVLGGQLLALLALLQTAPEGAPASFVLLNAAAMECLNEIRAVHRKGCEPGQ